MSYVNSLFIGKKIEKSQEYRPRKSVLLPFDIATSQRKSILMPQETSVIKRRSVMVPQDSNKLKELQDQITNERFKNAKLGDNISKAEESMQRKSEEYEKQIKELREQIMHYRLHPTPTIETINKHVEEAEGLHQKVILAISDFKSQLEQHMKDQEKDTVKRFDLKLAKICNEIEDRKKKRIMELSSMANTEKKTSKDLDTLRESAILVQKKNLILEAENNKLEMQIKQKDNEFQELMQEFYYAKKNSQRENKQDVLNNTFEPQISKMSINDSEICEDKTDRYEIVIAKLRKQLDVERKGLRAIRNAYAQEIDERTEMENIVRRFVEDIRENQAQKGRINSPQEERAILIDNLLNSNEVFMILTRGPYENESSGII